MRQSDGTRYDNFDDADENSNVNEHPRTYYHNNNRRSTSRRGQTSSLQSSPPSPEQSGTNRRRLGVCLSLGFVALVGMIIAGITVGIIFGTGDDDDDKNKLVNTDNKNSNVTTADDTRDPTSAPTPDGYMRCNGLENLCDVPVSDVFFATVHNAASTREDGVVFIPNHAYNLEAALIAGYRGINVDMGKCLSSGIQFVHGTCLLGTRDPKEVLTAIVNFLQKNPNEVLLLPMQIENRAEGGNVTIQEINEILQSVTGFNDMLYHHPSMNQPWPTLRTLIEANTRIIFMHYDAIQKCSELDGGICPNGFHEWFTYAAETSFTYDNVNSFDNTTNSCQLTRGTTNPRSSSPFIGINVFLTIPSEDLCTQLNSKEFLMNHIDQCSNLFNYKPNVLLIDCWDVGDVLEVIKEYNMKLDPTDYAATTSSPFTISPSSTTVSSSSSSSAEVLLSFENITTRMNSIDTFEEECATYFAASITFKNNSIENTECSLLSQRLITQSTRRLHTVGVTQYGDMTNHHHDNDNSRTLQQEEISVLQTLILISGYETKKTNKTLLSSTLLKSIVDLSANDFQEELKSNPDTSDDFETLSVIKATEVEDTTTSTNTTTAKSPTISPSLVSSPSFSTSTPTNDETSESSASLTPTLSITTAVTPTPIPSFSSTSSPSKSPVVASPVSCSMKDQKEIELPDSVGSVKLLTNSKTNTIMVEMTYIGSAWLGISFVENESMIPAVAIIGLPSNFNIAKYLLLSKSIAGISRNVLDQTLQDASIEQNGTHTVMKFTKILEEDDDIISIPISGDIMFNYAIGCSNDFDAVHCLKGTILHNDLQSCNGDVEEATTNTNSTVAAKNVTNTNTTAVATNDVTTTTIDDDMICNGHSNLCDVSVDRVFFATVHNAHVSTQDGFSIFPNHQFNLESALDAGYRGINVDFGVCNGALQLVHGDCSFGTRDPTTAFTNILMYLLANPNEVLLLPTEINDRLDGEVTNSAIDTIFQSIPGFKEMMYTHPGGKRTAWPTLRELIELNQRIIYMQYGNANDQRCYQNGVITGSCPSGFHDWFLYAAETPFEYASLEQFTDVTYSCQITRGPTEDPSFFGYNLFFSIPSESTCSTLNTRQFIETYMNSCSEYFNYIYIPNLLFVDCWNVGDVLAVVNEYNSNL